MRKITLFIPTALLLVAFLTGCNENVEKQLDNAGQVVEEKLTEAGKLAEAKLDAAMDKVGEKIDAAIDEAIEDIKKSLSDAIKGKIDDWLDQNLPEKSKVELTDDEYAKLVQEHPDLKEIFESETATEDTTETTE